MIIPKEKIDASIQNKRLQEEAKTSALLDAIMKKSKEVAKLPAIIREIMDTYCYINAQDKALGLEAWRAICNEDDQHRLDFCNAILNRPGGKCGVRPNYSNGKEYYTGIYVTSIGVFYGDECRSLYPIEDLPQHIDPRSYSHVLNSMCLLLTAIPAYKDSLANRFNSILNR